MATLPDLNPCPLNPWSVCLTSHGNTINFFRSCNIWGQCGITSEFCIATPADTGAPGTTQPGTNGCISHCGTDIVNNGAGPASFIRVGYYEFLQSWPTVYENVGKYHQHTFNIFAVH